MHVKHFFVHVRLENLSPFFLVHAEVCLYKKRHFFLSLSCAGVLTCVQKNANEHRLTMFALSLVTTAKNRVSFYKLAHNRKDSINAHYLYYNDGVFA